MQIYFEQVVNSLQEKFEYFKTEFHIHVFQNGGYVLVHIIQISNFTLQ